MKSKLSLEIEKFWSEGSKTVTQIKAKLKESGIEFKTSQIQTKLHMLRYDKKTMAEGYTLSDEQLLAKGVSEIMKGFKTNRSLDEKM